MTAKEKAKDLVSKMYVEYKPSENDASGVYVFYMNIEIAKRSALICVDEIIHEVYDDLEWWKNVKKEIEKL